MARPLLQIALDNNTLSDALKSISLVGHEVDVIEAGTILCLAEGMEAVRCLRALYPNKIILAEFDKFNDRAIFSFIGILIHVF